MYRDWPTANRLSVANSCESPAKLRQRTSEVANHKGGLRCCHSNQARQPHIRTRTVRIVAHVPEHYMYTEIGCSISSPVDRGGRRPPLSAFWPISRL